VRMNFKLLGAVTVAGVVATTGSAFTAANTGVDDAFVGYDSATISGVTVTNVEYVVSSSDASKLSSIVFTENENVSVGYESTLTVNGPTTTQIACSASFVTGTPGVGTITCPTTANVADVTSISLTVAAV
jgi:hypothetical protein